MIIHTKKIKKEICLYIWYISIHYTKDDMRYAIDELSLQCHCQFKDPRHAGLSNVVVLQGKLESVQPLGWNQVELIKFHSPQTNVAHFIVKHDEI